MSDETAKGFGIAIVAFILIFGGFIVGSSHACGEIVEALTLNGHGDQASVVKTLRICK